MYTQEDALTIIKNEFYVHVIAQKDGLYWARPIRRRIP